jgi:hypothetical protein
MRWLCCISKASRGPHFKILSWRRMTCRAGINARSPEQEHTVIWDGVEIQRFMHVEIASLLPDLAVIISITCTGLSSQLPCRLQGTAHFIIATCFCSVGNLWFKSIFWQRLLAYALQITAADQRTFKKL